MLNGVATSVTCLKSEFLPGIIMQARLDLENPPRRYLHCDDQHFVSDH